MAIIFHCQYCDKKIEAADSAGGKWGKCPSCHNKLYIPDMSSTEQELKLAPLDESDEQREKQLMAETYNLTRDILLERKADEQAGAEDTPASQVSDKELTKNIIVYLCQMAEGDLDEARQTETVIISCGSRSLKIIDEIALSEIPEPELASIPQQVLSALIRDLRSKIN